MMSTNYHNFDKYEKKLFSILIELNNEQVFYLINTEPPKVIALTLDQLEQKRKMKIMERFSPDMKHSIIMELGKLNEIPLEGVVSVAKELKNKISFLPSPKEFSRGGPKSIANILNQMTVEDAEQYLEQLSMDDPELYTEVKKHFLSFDDLLQMPDHIMKVFWRNPEIDVDDLSKALKGQEQSIIENISSLFLLFIPFFRAPEINLIDNSSIKPFFFFPIARRIISASAKVKSATSFAICITCS